MLRDNHARLHSYGWNLQRLMWLRRRILPRLRVLCPRFAVHQDAMLLEQRAKELGVRRSRFLDRERLVITRIAQRNRSPERQVERSWLTQNPDIARRSPAASRD